MTETRLDEIRARQEAGYYFSQDGASDIRWLLSEVERLTAENWLLHGPEVQRLRLENERLREALERIRDLPEERDEYSEITWVSAVALSEAQDIAVAALADPSTEAPRGGTEIQVHPGPVERTKHDFSRWGTEESREA